MTKIRTWDDVSAALDKMDELQRQIQKHIDKLNAKTAEANKKFDADTRDIKTEISELDDNVKGFALAHEVEFEESRTKKFPAGSVSLRQSSRLEIPNTKQTIALLKEAGRLDAIEVKEVISKSILKKLPDPELKRFEVTRVVDTSVLIRPNN